MLQHFPFFLVLYVNLENGKQNKISTYYYCKRKEDFVSIDGSNVSPSTPIPKQFGSLTSFSSEDATPTVSLSTKN